MEQMRTNVYSYNQPQFDGSTNEAFLQACVGDAYILGKNGIYFYDREKGSCERIQTAEKVKKNADLAEIFNLPQLINGEARVLTAKEIEKITMITRIAHQLRGLMGDDDYDAYMHRHEALKLLVERENFSEFVSTLPKIFANSESILLLFKNYEKSAKFWAIATGSSGAELRQMQGPMQGLISPLEIYRATALVRVFQEIRFDSENPKDVCQILGDICEKQYNDSVLAEKWFNEGKKFEHVEEVKPEEENKSHFRFR